MKRKYAIKCRFFVFYLIFLSLFLTLSGCKKTKVYSIGIINILPSMQEIINGFKQGITEYGYIEGKKLKYLYECPNVGIDKLNKIAQGLVKADVDLILSIATPATIVAKQATEGTGIPVVFVPVTNPVAAGIIDSIKKPGANITGITFGIQENRRLEWLIRIAPGIKHIYTAYNVQDPSPVFALKMIKETAKKLGVNITARKIHNTKELDYAVKNIPRNADAVILLPDSLVATHLEDFVNAAIKRKLPVSGANIEVVKKNSVLTSYGFDQFITGKQASRLADQIFHGIKPADLPVETAEFHLAINLKIAGEIGLNIPDEILRQADIIIR